MRHEVETLVVVMLDDAGDADGNWHSLKQKTMGGLDCLHREGCSPMTFTKGSAVKEGS